jgi:hypothetical protein
MIHYFSHFVPPRALGRGSQVWRDVLGAAEGSGPLRGLTAAAMPEWQWQSSQDAAVEVINFRLLYHPPWLPPE